MATKRVDAIALIKTLSGLDKGYFTFADLERITGQEKRSLKVTVSRLVKRGILARIKRGVYQLTGNLVDVKLVANQLYYPSYLSFESALSQYGILSQVPYAQTFATPKRSKKLVLWDTAVDYRQLRGDLYWGYTLVNGIYLAEPEKAILDQLYLVSRGKTTLSIEELSLAGINREKLTGYAEKFPEYVRPLVDKVLRLMTDK
jgi:predicted transcriptional regulator of viral defense system